MTIEELKSLLKTYDRLEYRLHKIYRETMDYNVYNDRHCYRMIIKQLKRFIKSIESKSDKQVKTTGDSKTS